MFAVLLVLGLVLPGGIFRLEARQLYQLGGAASSTFNRNPTAWERNGDLNFAASGRAGSLRPIEAELEQNLAALFVQRMAQVTTTPQTEGVPPDFFSDRLQMVDGDVHTAFVHEPQIRLYSDGFYTVPMFFDLGAPLPVERIRIRTRPDHPENLIRIYKLWSNDGSAATQTRFGNPIWSLLKDEQDNLNPVIDLDFEPRIIRRLFLRPEEVDVTWEVAELEVFGRGFTPSASFTSTPLDLGQPSSLGRIWWRGARDPEAKVLIQTRSGSDDQPEIFQRKTGIGDQEVPFDQQGRPLTRETYEALQPIQKGKITQDLENWSVWQTYNFEEGLEGTRLLSPSPRRFLQIRIQFFSQGFQGAQIDSLFFEFSQPPLATEATGEITPLLVEPALSTVFTYAVRARLEEGQKGFNTLEVRTPALLEEVHSVRIDREEQKFSRDFDPSNPHRFAVHFPPIIQDQTLLEVDFSARVFSFGTVFDGFVSNAEMDEVAQAVVPGDVVAEVPNDGLSVKTSLEGGGGLLSAVEAAPNPFTPNGDGINDQVRISFSLLQLSTVVPLDTEIYDLAGRRVRLLRTEGSSALYQVAWDGRDGQGRLVSPGLYLYRIKVEVDSGTQERLGSIAVAY